MNDLFISLRCTNHATAPLKAVGQNAPIVWGAIKSSPFRTSWSQHNRAALANRLRTHRLHRNLVIGIIAYLLAFAPPGWGWPTTVALLWQAAVIVAVGRQEIRVNEQLRECDLEDALGCGDNDLRLKHENGEWVPTGVSLLAMRRLHEEMKQAGMQAQQLTTSFKVLNDVMLMSELTNTPPERLIGIHTEP